MVSRIAILSLICAAAPVLADQPQFTITMEPADTDRFGCPIRPRPDHMTYSSFRDAWRSVAADKLYSLRRHRLVLETRTCDCATLRPEWSIIESEYHDLGFADGPSSTYDTWAKGAYFPVIADLRHAVREFCGEEG